MAARPSWSAKLGKNSLTPIRLFGIAATSQADLTNMPDVPVYINEQA